MAQAVCAAFENWFSPPEQTWGTLRSEQNMLPEPEPKDSQQNNLQAAKSSEADTHGIGMPLSNNLVVTAVWMTMCVSGGKHTHTATGTLQDE